MQQKHKIEPILYIEQPLFEKPHVLMQADYVSERIEQEEQTVEESSQLQENQHFHTGSIQEKINYFLQMPAEVPRLKCEIEMLEGSKYIGDIVMDEGDYIKVNLVGRLSERLKKSEIQDIRIIGF